MDIHLYIYLDPQGWCGVGSRKEALIGHSGTPRSRANFEQMDVNSREYSDVVFSVGHEAV
jgi:hypothetical protein